MYFKCTQTGPYFLFWHLTLVFLSIVPDNVYILTTELRSSHMVKEGCCFADFRINHSSWWNTDQASVVIGNLTHMLPGNEPRCGRKWTSTRTINSILFSKQSLPKDREISHLCKVELLCVYAHLVPSTMWMTHLAWCWTSWRRSASVCWRWRGWDRRWCGAYTRRRSDGSADCLFEKKPLKALERINRRTSSILVKTLLLVLYICGTLAAAKSALFPVKI